MLITDNISFSYDGKQVLSFPNVQCDAAEAHLILGPSGCGKTTLLHLLGGLLQPSAGSIRIKDVDIGTLNGIALDKFRGKHIGIVFQRPHFMRALNVEENLMLAQRLAGVAVDKQKVRQTLDRLGVLHKAHSMTSKLSVGEQQRVVIGRAIINDPDVILADEPTSALDDGNCERFFELLEELSIEEKASLVVVTHDNRLKDRISKQTILTPIT